MSADLRPDAIGPWSLLVADVIGGVTILTGYGPMPRSAAEAQLDVLGLCAYDEPLVPSSLKVEEPGITPSPRSPAISPPSISEWADA
jgi:hypothetical protein